jgi:hypothetical protein
MNTGMEYEDILMRNQELMATINRLTAERDEARRMYCEHGTYTHPRQLAEELRWDCYRRTTNGIRSFNDVW